MDNAPERTHIQARTAHQHPVNVGLGHQAVHIVRFNRSSIHYSDAVGNCFVPQGRTPLSNESMHFLSLFRSSRPPGANGPDRFIGNGELAGLVGRETLQSLFQLGANNGKGPAPFAFFEYFADTEDRQEATPEGTGKFLLNELVGFPERAADVPNAPGSRHRNRHP